MIYIEIWEWVGTRYYLSLYMIYIEMWEWVAITSYFIFLDFKFRRKHIINSVLHRTTPKVASKAVFLSVKLKAKAIRHLEARRRHGFFRSEKREEERSKRNWISWRWSRWSKWRNRWMEKWVFFKTPSTGSGLLLFVMKWLPRLSTIYPYTLLVSPTYPEHFFYLCIYYYLRYPLTPVFDPMLYSHFYSRNSKGSHFLECWMRIIYTIYFWYLNIEVR